MSPARRGRTDLRTAVGSVALPNPVLTASGTAGHGAELGAYFDLSSLGAVVVKSLAAGPWPGNPAPRVAEMPAGMLNSVGLQGPGVAAWIEQDLPALTDRGARVVASIWGRSVDDYARAATALAGAPGVVAGEWANIRLRSSRLGQLTLTSTATTPGAPASAAAARA